MGRARAERRHPQRYASRDVSIAYIRPDYIPGNFADCLAKLLLWDSKHDSRVGQVLAYASGPLIAQARNEVVQAFLDADTTWLLMVDADMAFKAPILDEMLRVITEKATIAAERDEIKVLGALCYVGGRDGILPRPTVYTEPEPGVFLHVHQVPENVLLKVAATGAAFLLVHRQVLEDIHTKYEDDPYTWFKECHDDVGAYGEDVTFCRRARECGHDIWVHTAFTIGHMKLTPLNDYTARRLARAGPDELEAEESAYYNALGVQ